MFEILGNILKLILAIIFGVRIFRVLEVLGKLPYSNIFFYKPIAPTVLKFYMEHDLPPGSQNYKTGSGRISKMAAITKNSKNNKINFFSRTAEYFWLNFGMEYQWNKGIQNCKNVKNL